LLRRIAQQKGLLLSEYGVFRGKKKLVGATEEEVYKVLDQKWIHPEKRIGETELSP
jgi:DNA polymerase (family 10)